jgi:hypothetical protein
MGYQVIGNIMRERVYFSLNTFKPNKLFLETYNSLTFDYWSNPVSKKSTYQSASLDLYATLLNLSGISFHGEVHPGNTYDYYEPRVEGRYSRTWKVFFSNLSITTNTRKKLGLELVFNYGRFFDESEPGDGYGINPTIRFRASNKLLIRVGGEHFNDTYNVGFADIDSTNTIIYGGRHLRTWVMKAELRYMFKNDMSLNIVGRHYWNNGTYLDYYTLLDNGDLEKNIVYSGVNDYSYNAFNIDLVYSWKFAPGSIVSI